MQKDSAGRTLTLRQIAKQAANIAAEAPNGKRRGHPEGKDLGVDRAISHTSGTGTYYVDDVSSSPNKDNSLSQTDHKVHLTFSNTQKMI